MRVENEDATSADDHKARAAICEPDCQQRRRADPNGPEAPPAWQIPAGDIRRGWMSGIVIEPVCVIDDPIVRGDRDAA
jgi:hypothetical protein